jgi:hypothetical protein
VDGHRQAVGRRERELPLESCPLDIGRRQVPVVVEPDLADCPRQWVSGQRFESRPPSLVHLRSVVGMDSDARVDDLAMALRELQGGL